MIEDKLRKEYLSTYYGEADKLSTWFTAGHMNLKVAELLLKKYKSAHKRRQIEAEESVTLGVNAKKRRIDPYHLVLHKYILMFFGYSLECYLKGLLIHQKKLNPLNSDKTNISNKILIHLSIQMFNDALDKPSKEEKGVIERLRRAIDAGKYPIEKGMTGLSAYTANLDSDIKETRIMIKKAKKKWDELRFS